MGLWSAVDERGVYFGGSVWRRHRARRNLRALLAVGLTAALTASLLVVLPEMALGAPDPGRSPSKPTQITGSADGRDHSAKAADTAASGSQPHGDPVRPPGAKDVVGIEQRYPDPLSVDAAQCVDCPPGTQPVRPKAGEYRATNTEQRASGLRSSEVTGFQAGKSTELVAERTEDSTVFANPDGTRTARFYSQRTYARDRSGAMVPIDTTLSRGEDHRFRPAVDLDVSFGEQAVAEQLATLSLGGGLQAGFGLAGAAPVAGAADGANVRFAEVRPGVDLVLTATGNGLKDELVLKSADAPTTWVFPLRLVGLTPELVGNGIELRDAEGQVRASIPPGFMYDATPDPKTGAGVRSNGVTYRLLGDGDVWQVEVTLDAGWLRSPERRFPVTVDPPLSMRDNRYLDTFVSSKLFANRDNGLESFLGVGSSDGVEKMATYIDFLARIDLKQKYIVGASLSVYQTWAQSCTNANVTVYPVTQQWYPWQGAGLSWPGPAYSSDPIGQKSFNRGGLCSSKPEGWESIPLDAAQFTTLLDRNHDMFGFTLRASNADPNALKFFRSGENAGGGGPILDVLYSDDGASYSLPTSVFSPPVTPQTAGQIEVRVKNLGAHTWTPTGFYDLFTTVVDSGGNVVDYSFTDPPHNIGPLESGTFLMTVNPLPAGTYTVKLDMSGPDAEFSYFGVPIATFSFKVLPAATPEILSIYPANNAQVDSLRPTLWGQYYDADNAPSTPNYWFQVCNGTPDALVDCQDTGWITSSTWTVPAGVMSWGKTSFWSIAVYDGANMSYLEGPYAVTPVVAQPSVTGHLAVTSDNTDIVGLNPQVGNYSSTVVDASVPVPGPPLQVRRTYNSQDYRGSGSDNNVALGRAASGSTVCTTTQGPEKAINGSTSGGLDDKWCSSASSRWLQVDLGTNRTVRSFVIRHAGAGGESSAWNTRDYNIETSTDGTVWSTAVTVTGNTANVTTSTITARTARYVKLNVVTPTQDGSASARIYEFEVNGNSGAFGAGWSTPLDQVLLADPDGSGNVVVTLDSGREVRFGRNVDGTYAPPPGLAMQLVKGTSAWTLRDSSGGKRIFDNQGNLTSVIDASGRAQQYVYTSGRVSKVTDTTSGRSLYLTWTDGKVTAIKADAPTTGATQPTWTYQYSDNKLIRVCSPLVATSCVDYGHASSSHYRSLVVDDNPLAYWPMSEKSGGTAANVVATTKGEFDATYTAVTLNQAGALQGTTDTAASFDMAAKSSMALPDNLLTSTMAFTVELWFKAASGKTGVLYGEQNTPLGTTPQRWSPALYIGTDGKLHGRAWATGGTQAVSISRVDNGAWHHAAIAVNLDRQDIYLDGVRIGGFTGREVYRADMSKAAIGNGYAANWPNAGTGYLPFTGQIDDVAVYRHALGPLQIAAHYAARTASVRLASVTEPNGYVSVELTYDAGSGRVATIRDHDGATWTVGAPTVGDGTHKVALSSTGRDTVTYTYDARRGERLVEHTTNVGTEKWEYDANGFVTTYTDANGRDSIFYRDARGNITWEGVFQSGTWRWKNWGYYVNAADPLDPRNDRVMWRSGTRNAWDGDPRNRIVYELGTVGQVTKITYPGPAGAPGVPTELIAYTTGAESAVGGGLMPAGLPRTLTNPLGGVTTHSYTSKGDLASTVNPVGLTTTYVYDLLGRATARTDSAVVAGGSVTYGSWTTEYNNASLVIAETAPGITNPVTGQTHTARTNYFYNNSGKLFAKTIEDTTGGDLSRDWAYGYDPAGRVTSVTSPDGTVEGRQWNTAGDLAELTEPNGLVLNYYYDDARRLVETVATGTGVDPADPNSTQLVLESRAYDPAGQLAFVTDATGRETAYTYHNDGLPETVKRIRRDANGSVVSSTELARYEYDYGGNLIRVTEAGGVVHDFDYDDAGLRNRETLDAGGLARSVVRTFALDGSVASETSTNGFTFITGRSAETPYLLSAGGSQIDGAGNRYVDGTATMTYRFTFPADAISGTLNLEIDNQYLIESSPDNATWTEIGRESRDIRDGSNRIQLLRDLTATLAQSKTLYVRIRDSQPSNGWGGALSRVALQYNRTGQQAAKTSYEYDLNGALTRTTIGNPGGAPSNLVTQTLRDPRGLVYRLVDPASNTTGYAYDATGHLVTTTEPARTVWRDGVRTDDFAPVTTYGLNTFGEVTHQRDAYGAIQTTGYDGMGRATSVTQPPYVPAGGVTLTPTTTTTYTFDGQPATITDPLGRRTVYEYDKYGRLASLAQSDPDGDGSQLAPAWLYQYDRVGELLESTDPTGARTSATYNDLSYQITSTVAERTDTSIRYLTTQLGRTDDGLLTSITTPLGSVTTAEYNKAGEPTLVTDPTGQTVEQRYDALGQLTAQILAGTRATSYSYDAAGRLVVAADHTVTAGELSAPLRQRHADYDALGRPIQTTSAAGRVTRYDYGPGPEPSTVTQTITADTEVSVELGYDARGRRTRMVDGNGNATDYLYNDWGLGTAVREPGSEDPAERTWTSSYDEAGQLVAEQLPGGVSRTRRYDGAGRLVEETGTGAAGPTPARVFDYDLVGRLTAVSGPDVDRTYRYNDHGLLVSATGPGTTATFTYDDDGNLVNRTDSAGTGTFGYDKAGRLTTIGDALSPRIATYTYTPTGELSAINYGTSKPSRAFSYDALGRPTSDTVKAADQSTVLTTNYSYDPDDLLLSRNTTGYTGGGSNTYGYDGMGRLATWTGPDGAQVSYGYDGASNRTSVSTPESDERHFVFDARNRLTSAAGGGQPDLTNTWSARGTLDSSTVGDTATTYQYDAFDKLASAQNATTSVAYQYDALGRLAARDGAALNYADLTNNPVQVPTAWGDAVVFRDPGGNAFSDRYGTDPGQLLINDPVHGDRTGAIDNLTGTVLATRSYEPYGQVTASSGKYSAGYQDGWTDPATGQVNTAARWYDPGQASFTSRDTVTLTPDPVAQSNRYAYANANPTTYNDPTGNCPFCAGWALWEAGAFLVVAIATYMAVDQWAKSGAAEDAIRSLYALGDAAITAMLDDLKEMGDSAIDAISQIRAQFADNARVQSITSRVPGTAPWVSTPTTTTAPSTVTTTTPPVSMPAVAPPSIADTLAHVTPAPPVALLPAGQLAGNAVTQSIGVAIPSLVLAEADASQAANRSIDGSPDTPNTGTAATGYGISTPSQPPNCGDASILFHDCGTGDLAREGTPGPAFPRTMENAPSLDPQRYVEDIADYFRINLRGSGQRISVLYDDTLPEGQFGVTRPNEGGRVIRIGPTAIRGGDGTTANTIAHELSHARDFLRGGLHKPHGNVWDIANGTPYGSGNALEAWWLGLL